MIFTTSQAKLTYPILIILLTPLNLLGYYTSAPVQGDTKEKKINHHGKREKDLKLPFRRRVLGFSLEVPF